MSISAVNDIVEVKIASLLAVAIAYDNVEFKEQSGTPFVELELECTSSSDIAIKCRREVFLITLKVHTPFGEGTGRNLTVADSIVNGLVGYQTGAFKCTGGRVARGEKVREWHQRTVYLDARYDQTF